MALETIAISSELELVFITWLININAIVTYVYGIARNWSYFHVKALIRLTENVSTAVKSIFLNQNLQLYVLFDTSNSFRCDMYIICVTDRYILNCMLRVLYEKFVYHRQLDVYLDFMHGFVH